MCAADTCYRLTTNNYEELALNKWGNVVMKDKAWSRKHGKITSNIPNTPL